MGKDAYAKAGVDIHAGDEAVQKMRSVVEATYTPQVLAGLGGFGSVFELPVGYQHQVLVSGTDGVGTKLLLAIGADKHDTIGQDLVAMVMNDIIAEGAKPLFLQDYLAVDKMRPETAAEIISGIAQATKAVGASLIGGESAELPGLYAEKHYDLAAFGVGIAEKDEILDSPKNATAGDILLGLPSSGIHSNGYSLVRLVFGIKDSKDFKKLSDDLQSQLLTPTTLYYPLISKLLDNHQITGISNITGGGIVGNLPRAFSKNLQAKLTWGSWPVLDIFNLLQQTGDLSTKDMLKTFNNGLGMILIVKPGNLNAVMNHFKKINQSVYEIGKLQPKTNSTDAEVIFEGESPWKK
ncbi:phosphoribosylformylglycinamidine cyclo-ligase [Fructilactobacillus lindneri]|uniref:Phosphoribosylformylglycinamidine cyclo-ligase n=2 Tax=Fructilactobacillus lindneri TaxID=53444 RepID=A0A0R2JN66_9LACO|nr:phosphoribosylformylglycinamidine cyclo-ligase [Fructilactobacillus lindneri]ANZ59175.1 hypothetical protein AYR59_03595 [Fructilactobacillus lindneri]KRN78624.1 phosphoribosylaminoimidazole synthetase [Fructilactobacillus lindneri DSM 20690 = JCM 11027]POG98225.1 phosphoribosylformylglycinamidine cyclo-ligase [Fructilactobacillus lindneri]POH01658.1 phosphoribosylformylglycinamidine cyclo-ligase [Fructilactobacillus lindneri]POH03501.1 phosphoribosylformylglycinamidine cyclo-ligase [Fructi